MAKLGDICTNQSSNIKQADLETLNGEYPIYGASGFIKNVDFYKQDKPYVAIVKDGAGIGRIMQLPAFSSVIGTMQYIIPNDNTDVKYLAYAMEHMNLSKYYTGATIPHIYFKDYKNEPIKEHDFATQKQIASNLDKVIHTIGLCNSILEKLDLLVKSRFVEMFGDLETNPFGWDVVNIVNILSGTALNGFFAKRDEYCKNGNVSVLGVANIVNRMYSNIKTLPKANATDKDISKYEVKYGDMLFCRSSLVVEGIGKASIVPANVPKNVLFECHVIRLPLDLNKCIPEFMQVQSTTDFFRKQVIAQSKTATMTTIGQDGILKTNVILPPIEKQQEYYNYVKQTDKSKLAVKQVLEKAETLKKALMQEYFG